MVDINTNSSGDTAWLFELSGDVLSKIIKSSDYTTSKQSKGGKPVGTIMKAKEEQKSNIFEAKNKISKRFSAVKKNARMISLKMEL